MRTHASIPGNLTGSILIATPILKDPHFCKTILFLSHHSPEDGALGFVLNRPLKKTMGEVLPSSDSAGIFAQVPLFYGGPIAQDEVNVASFRWIEQPQAVKFQSFAKIPNLPAEQLQGLRAFAGHSGWERGQLEQEIAQKTWFIVDPNRDLINMPYPDSAWKDTLRQMGPILKLLAEAPEDPSLN